MIYARIKLLHTLDSLTVHIKKKQNTSILSKILYSNNFMQSWSLLNEKSIWFKKPQKWKAFDIERKEPEFGL